MCSGVCVLGSDSDDEGRLRLTEYDAEDGGRAEFSAEHRQEQEQEGVRCAVSARGVLGQHANEARSHESGKTDQNV